jgi:flagellar basal-body rod protein FlgG
MMAQELNVQVISNNIANMRTTGYKRQRVEFQDLLYEHVSRIGTQTSANGNILPVGIDLGGGVKTVGTPRLMTQGTLSQTGSNLDVAIRGDGFFKIQMPDGTYAYTRDGSFQMDAQGRVVTAQGNVVAPGITIPQNATGLTINAQGQVAVTPSGSTTPTVLGQLTLTRFVNQAGLLAIGDNMFTDTPASGTPTSGGEFQDVAKRVANVDTLDTFMRDMRARYPDAGLPPDDAAAKAGETPAATPAAPAKPNGPAAQAAAPDKAALNAPVKPDPAASPLPPKAPAGVPLKPDRSPTGSISRLPRAKTNAR